uniref:AA_permease domain-containing protein n=1 Tax=Angiostrongylus cantonensis TaxID=6313 RepID=A0A0K0D2S0_ANGCA
MVGLLLIGTLNSNIFCGSRFMYAAAREGHLPTFLSCVSDKSNSPRAAVLGQMICAFVVSFIDIETLINYVTFVMWAQKAVTVAALLYIRHSKLPVAEDAIKVPIGLTVFFMVISLLLVLVPFVEEPVVTFTGVVVVFSGLTFFYALVNPDETPRLLQVINDKLTRVTCRLLYCRPDVKKGVQKIDKDSDELQGLDSPSRL